MLLFAVLQVAFSNFAETPFAVEYKFIAVRPCSSQISRPIFFFLKLTSLPQYKHINAGMYPPWAYTLSATIVQLPTAVAETAAFSVILYFMVGLVAGARASPPSVCDFLVNLPPPLFEFHSFQTAGGGRFSHSLSTSSTSASAPFSASSPTWCQTTRRRKRPPGRSSPSR